MPEAALDNTERFAEIESQQASFLEEAGRFFPSEQNIAPPEAPPESKPQPKTDIPKPTPTPPKKGALAEPPTDKKVDAPAPEPEIPREFHGTDKKRKVQWDALHSKHDAAEARALALEAQIRDFEGKIATATAPKANPEADAQLLALQNERNQYSEILQAVAAERHPKFQQQFQGRIASALELAKQAVGPENADRITQLLQLPDADYRNGQLDDIISNLGEMKKGKLNTAISQMDLIAAERSQMASQGQQLYKQWTQEAAEKLRVQKAQIQEQTLKAFQQEGESWKSAEIFTPKENDAAHNSRVAQSIEDAKAIFMGELDEKQLARASYWAVYGQRAVATMSTVTAENKALKAEIAALKATKPGPPSGGQPSAESEKDDGSMTYGQRLAQQALDQGFIRQ